ncbi:MAG TPA: tetratricopeptide repeat protein, partial [Candidatus Kapabacteria bacterium]
EKFGEAHFTVQNEMKWLADILTREGKFLEAEPLHRAVIKSVEGTLGSDSLDLAYYLNEFGVFFQRKGFHREIIHNRTSLSTDNSDYIEAEEIFERAVTIIEKRLGKNHKDLPNLLSNFASLYSQQGNWEKAKALLLKGLSIVEIAFGARHANVALSLSNYGTVLFRAQEYKEAESTYRRAAQIYSETLGDNHLETATAYNNLANTLRRQGNYDEAQEYYEKTLQIRLKTLGPMHIDSSRTLEGLARFMRIKNDLGKSLDYFQRSYEAKRHSLGSEDKNTLYIAFAIVEVLFELSKLKEAREFFLCKIQPTSSETIIATRAEMLARLGEDRAIPEEISQAIVALS